jgi:ankyrin repeat protein
VTRRFSFAVLVQVLAMVLVLGAAAPYGAHAANDPLADLMSAIDNDNIPAAKNLLSRGMDADSVDQMGSTLLMRASRTGSANMVEFLLQAGAKVNSRNAFGDSALMLAALNGHLEVCKILLHHGAEYDHEGWNPIIYAASRGHDDVVLLLLSLDCDIDATSANGTTALMLAADGGHLSTVKLLLEHSADFTLANEAGLTAMAWAARRNNTEIVEMLKAAGAGR